MNLPLDSRHLSFSSITTPTITSFAMQSSAPSRNNNKKVFDNSSQTHHRLPRTTIHTATITVDIDSVLSIITHLLDCRVWPTVKQSDPALFVRPSSVVSSYHFLSLSRLFNLRQPGSSLNQPPEHHHHDFAIPTSTVPRSSQACT